MGALMIAGMAFLSSTLTGLQASEPSAVIDQSLQNIATDSSTNGDALYARGAGDVERLARGPSGVQEIKWTRTGQLQSVKIISKAVIPTGLGRAKGIETAERFADIQARKLFSNFLTSKVKVTESSSGEVILTQDGQNGSAKSADNYNHSIESTSEKVMRGLQIIGSAEIDGRLAVIYGWSAKVSSAAKDIGSPTVGAKKTIPEIRSNYRPSTSGMPLNSVVVGRDFDQF